MASDGQAFLLTLGSREGLRWVLQNRRMAFTTSSGALQLDVGDRLFLYASRRCYGDRVGNRGLLIGEAKVSSSVRSLERSVNLDGRSLSYECGIDLVRLAPFGEGVDFAELVPRLTVFPDKRWWSARLRRSLLKLPDADAALIATTLPKAPPAKKAIAGYLRP